MPWGRRKRASLVDSASTSGPTGMLPNSFRTSREMSAKSVASSGEIGVVRQQVDADDLLRSRLDAEVGHLLLRHLSDAAFGERVLDAVEDVGTMGEKPADAEVASHFFVGRGEVDDVALGRAAAVRDGD